MTRGVTGFGAAAAAVLMISSPAMAAPAPPADLASLQAQLNALRSDYEAKISDLERRLKAAEEQVAAAPVPNANVQAAPGEVMIADAAPTPEPVSKSASANAMNPGVSVVLNGNWVATRRDPRGAAISGYALGDETGGLPRGFSLGESEVTLAANVDPYLSANLTASFSGDNEVSVEEAYIQSTALPAGITLKAGRFFSAVGYLNERHAHNWSFIDMPLPYRALLGNQYGDDGVQARWLAPTPFFLELGTELYAGNSYPAGNTSKNGAGTQTAFVRTGGDFNDSSSWLAGLSYLHTEAHDRETAGVAGPDLFSGTDGLGIASAVYKWAPGGNPAEKNFVFSGEYFFGRQDGTFNGVPIRRDQNGWYAQGVYQFTKRWTAGLRYAALDEVGVRAALAGSTLDGLGRKPSAWSGLVEYDSSEFGRFRLQYTRDEADARPNDTLMFQYTVVYGPHGAHRY